MITPPPRGPPAHQAQPSTLEPLLLGHGYAHVPHAAAEHVKQRAAANAAANVKVQVAAVAAAARGEAETAAITAAAAAAAAQKIINSFKRSRERAGQAGKDRAARESKVAMQQHACKQACMHAQESTSAWGPQGPAASLLVHPSRRPHPSLPVANDEAAATEVEAITAAQRIIDSFKRSREKAAAKADLAVEHASRLTLNRRHRLLRHAAPLDCQGTARPADDDVEVAVDRERASADTTPPAKSARACERAYAWPSPELSTGMHGASSPPPPARLPAAIVAHRVRVDKREEAGATAAAPQFAPARQVFDLKELKAEHFKAAQLYHQLAAVPARAWWVDDTQARPRI